LGIIPFTAVIAAAVWGVGLFVQARAQVAVVAETETRVTTFV
jgi:hypothetical protein